MKPVSQRKWQLRQEISQLEAKTATLAGQLKVAPLTAQLLLLRGVEDLAGAQAFLGAGLAALPDPALLPGMEVACDRIVGALENGERIAIHGDYDVDGITGCTLLAEVLQQLGADISFHIPLRMKDGYGLSGDALREAAGSGCTLAISVDCGVSAVAEAELASELGLDLIITDHHQPPDVLPRALALVNPHLAGNSFPWPNLAGVGVAFFLRIGLRRSLRERNFFAKKVEPDLRHCLDLVALGTIADLVPLTGVNRILVRTGLQLLEQGHRAGVSALKEVAEVKAVTSGSVGFRLAPRLNAAGRLEDASLGVELLLNDSKQDKGELAALLDGFNRERQQIEQQTLEDAIQMLETNYPDEAKTIVLASEDWHSGVIGIVASRLVERYHRPTVLIALEDGNVGKGSSRSISAFHLHAALKDCEEHFIGFGGHAMAAGLSIETERVAAFRERFEQLAQERLGVDDLIPRLQYDGEIALEQLSIALLHELEQLGPHGMGNPQSAFVSRSCAVYDVRVLKDKHLKFAVEQNGVRRDCIAFGQAEHYERCNGYIDLIYRPSINEWRGKESVQLQILDFRNAE